MLQAIGQTKSGHLQGNGTTFYETFATKSAPQMLGILATRGKPPEHCSNAQKAKGKPRQQQQEQQEQEQEQRQQQQRRQKQELYYRQLVK